MIERYWTNEEAQTALKGRLDGLNELEFSVTESESIIPDRTLPNAEQVVELGKFLHRAFVVLRLISYGRKDFEAIERLTDVLHNFPVEMFDPEQWDWNSYIHALREFQKEFPDVQTLGIAAMLEGIRDNPEGKE